MQHVSSKPLTLASGSIPLSAILSCKISEAEQLADRMIIRISDTLDAHDPVERVAQIVAGGWATAIVDDIATARRRFTFNKANC